MSQQQKHEFWQEIVKECCEEATTLYKRIKELEAELAPLKMRHAHLCAMKLQAQKHLVPVTKVLTGTSGRRPTDTSLASQVASLSAAEISGVIEALEARMRLRQATG
jgi:cell division septum initiation protein DivIVA